MTVTQAFGQLIAQTEYQRLSGPIIEETKNRLLDTAGAALATCISWEYRSRFLHAYDYIPGGSCRVFGGAPRRYPVQTAARISAALAHGLELDDGHKRAGVHAGATVVSTALTLGAYLGRSGRELLEAILVGYELVYRLSVAQSPHLIDKGFHPTTVCGTLGAAAAAAKLLRLTAEQAAEAMGLAGMFTGGTMEATLSGQNSKCVMVGKAAADGIEAVYLAQAGIPGAAQVFEGKSGLFTSMSREVDVAAMLAGLGEEWLIGDTYNKFYPSCRHAQAAIETTLNLLAEQDFTWEDVERIEVGTYQVACELTGKIFAPANPGEAKFSIRYGVAAALLDHSFGVRHLTQPYYTHPRYTALAEKVLVHRDETVQSYYPQRRGAQVRIFLHDGRTVSGECYELKGSPGNPVGREQLVGKFRENTSPLLPENKLDELIDELLHIEGRKDISVGLDALWEYAPGLEREDRK